MKVVFLKNNTIKAKITLLSLLAMCIIVLMSFVTYMFTNYVTYSFQMMKAKELKIKNISYSLKNNIDALHKAILTQSLLEKHGTIDTKTIDNFHKIITTNFDDIHHVMVVTHNIEGLETLEKLNIRYKSYYDMAKILPIQFLKNFDDGVDDLIGINAISTKMFEELDSFIVKSDKRFNTRLTEIDNNMTHMMNTFFTISIVSLLVFLIFGYILQHTILSSLKNLADGIDKFFNYLSQKTSTVNDIEIVYNDELGEIATQVNKHIHEAEILIGNERKFTENLEQRVTEEVEKNIQNELMLFEQAKMASMGEMIGNIAHQWRQPLSLISTYASGMILQKECGILSDEDLIDKCNKINESTQRLSNIITTFRNYLMENKEFTDVILQDTLKEALDIVEIVLIDNGIKLTRKCEVTEPIIIKMVSGELSEVIINIINNAKDALLENNVEEPYVVVGLVKSTSQVVLTIEDNGGGVPTHIIDKIFDQHFTTKDKSHGTGIGLYMSYQIITDSLGGKLSVENTSSGAKFIIQIPLPEDKKIVF